MDDANQSTGAESLTVDDTAKRLMNIFDEPQNEDVNHKEDAKSDEDVKDKPEVSGAEQPQEAETESQELSFESIQQLADSLEVPIDVIMDKVKAKVKVAGEEREVTLKELRDGYQMESDYRKKTSELSEQRSALAAEHERVANELSARFQEAQQINGYLEQQLLGEYNRVNWSELRSTDPAEFAALKQEYNERFNHIQQLKVVVQQQLQAAHDEREQKQSESFRRMVEEESERLKAAIPDFADAEKSKAIKSQMKDYLQTYGYSDHEINQVYDHRHVMILKDAMAYRAMQAKRPELTKKIVNVPSVLKPGSSKSKQEAKSEQLRQKLQRVKSTGSTQDLASLLADRI